MVLVLAMLVILYFVTASIYHRTAYLLSLLHLTVIMGFFWQGQTFVSRGFVYVRESEAHGRGKEVVVTNTLEHCNSKKITDWGRIKETIRDDLGDYIWKEDEEVR